MEQVCFLKYWFFLFVKCLYILSVVTTDKSEELISEEEATIDWILLPH